VLISLRATTPHQPQQIIADGIAQDRTKPIEIECAFRLTDEEVIAIEASLPPIATTLVRTRSGFGNNPAAFTAFITSPVGKAALLGAENEVRGGLEKLKKDQTCRLAIKIDFTKDRMEGADPIHAVFFQFLEQRLPPHLSLFSYRSSAIFRPIVLSHLASSQSRSGCKTLSNNSSPITHSHTRNTPASRTQFSTRLS
jgi:hypothetical protein